MYIRVFAVRYSICPPRQARLACIEFVNQKTYRTKFGVGGVCSVDLNKTSLLGCECCDELALPYFVAFIENARRCQQNLIPDTRCEAIQYQPDMLTTV